MHKKQQQIPQSEIVSLYRNALMHGVPLDKVEDSIETHLHRLSTTQKIEQAQAASETKKVATALHPAIRLGAFFLPLLFISFGLYLVASAMIPIATYYVQGKFGDMAQLTSPIPSEEVMDVTPLVITQAKAQGENAPAQHAPRIIDVDLDYTDLSNWFDAATASQLDFQAPTGEASVYYTLDIPKLNIQNARVERGGTDLNKNLIAYPGTAKPGEYGAPVIFGHSVLRQFYNPSEKNSRRYNSIFSTIMTLQKGDEIFITYDNVKYTYVVQEKTEVKPTDVYILSQKYDAQRLKLVTCTPEGTFLRRGVVTAQLVKTE